MKLSIILVILYITCAWVKSNTEDPPPPPYEEFYYMQTLDHFNFYNKGSFPQRYLVSDTYWTRPTGPICESPVLFYTGNEGDIVWFYENSQFVTNVLAKEMGALLVFAEHRFYGETMPFGNSSSLPENIGYLTSEQALADYAQLIPAVLSDLGGSHCPVLAVGGSYGGMLASWFRMKYPNIIDGALAASAPILYFLGTNANSEGFNEIATIDFAETSSEGTCATRIHSAFNEITQMSNTQNGLNVLTKTFSLCEELTELSDLINWLEAAITYMAMADYPYPANFLEPMPGNPINVSCSLLAKETDNIQGLVQVMNVYFNSSGQAGQCNNVSVYTTGALGSDGWDYQACTEMVMPISANGVQDFFPAAPWSLSQLTQYCQQTWQVTPNPNWITTYYQGQDLSQTSNIIFSNGVLDPWRAGGVVSNDGGNDIITIIIDGGAHHLDLRMPNSADPTAVTNARVLETKYLMQFAQEASFKKQLKSK
ncbi:peptidase S28 family protein [Heterostelium album PN500]|uniref:Peptidase S28 family protein n=1 Tax=Heterostelium pallidum (strain ATCC 26659 / Pp 5 / PN500) TaxID=670386 RepID=D3BEB6_HETP5|nr:peptidase S28 family protein [Heterostelium album PN500]EFA80247.1 peptidase S28 family protein [Heterostelium album PN500]|eukprot:XP_020432367.1 peptidase S28 family protein [Heterostelium album PN500]